MQLLYKHGISVKSVLHVGGHRAQELESYQRNGIVSGLFVEAQEHLHRATEDGFSDKVNWKSINALLSDSDGELVNFFLSSNDGMSSSLLSPSGHLVEHPEVQFSLGTQMRTSKLDSLDLGSFDLTVLDVQGAELKVLRGGMETISNSQAIWLEVSVGGLYRGDPTINDIVAFLDQHNFVIVYVDLLKHLWGDALFLSRSAMHVYGS